MLPFSAEEELTAEQKSAFSKKTNLSVNPENSDPNNRKTFSAQ